MGRVTLATLMNLLVPGCGLIALGQPWLGLAIAAWFGLAAELALCGLLIAPAALPQTMTAGTACLALTAWGVGQGLQIRRAWRFRLARKAMHPARPRQR
jgi:hypothetical protein